jgi:hypothetical protein
MKKYLFSSLLLAIVSSSFSQTTTQKLEQLKNDPKTAEKAAKADAIIINKKNVTDSASKLMC